MSKNTAEETAAPPAMMKALEIDLLNKGTTKVIEFPKPVPVASELLVKVKFSAIDTALIGIGDNDMTAPFMRNMKTKPIRFGYHFSGVVEAVGPAGSSFSVGDAVFGHLQYLPETLQGSCSEYITVASETCAVKPASMSFEVAAACTTEGVTALMALRDNGKLKEGQSVLILGAGGSVGTAAVGIAKALGAGSVTAVCSSRDVEKVKSLGADVVVDRSKQDITKASSFGNKKFDVVFDVPSKYRTWNATTWLKRAGTFVNTLPFWMLDIVLFGWAVTLFTGIKFETVYCSSNTKDLELVAEWIDSGSLKIDIEATFKVSDFDAAWKRFLGPKSGRVVIQVEDGW